MGPGESETQTPAEPSGLASVLDRAFGLSAAGTTMPTELRAGLATFLTMAYIMFVNPAILEKAGPHRARPRHGAQRLFRLYHGARTRR